jgi:hypothetical protein
MVTKKLASSYPPGFRKEAPNKGFAVKADADYRTIDPYNLHNDATESEEIWNLLQTEAGRQALGAQMAIPIRSQLNDNLAG